MGGDFITEEIQTPDVLKCDEFRDFWIVLSQSSVSIGRGRKPLDSKIGELQDPNLFHINGASIRTVRNQGRWVFYKSSGTFILIYNLHIFEH